MSVLQLPADVSATAVALRAKGDAVLPAAVNQHELLTSAAGILLVAAVLFLHCRMCSYPA
jgi:hypothetical protein